MFAQKHHPYGKHVSSALCDLRRHSTCMCQMSQRAAAVVWCLQQRTIPKLVQGVGLTGTHQTYDASPTHLPVRGFPVMDLFQKQQGCSHVAARRALQSSLQALHQRWLSTSLCYWKDLQSFCCGCRGGNACMITHS